MILHINYWKSLRTKCDWFGSLFPVIQTVEILWFNFSTADINWCEQLKICELMVVLNAVYPIAKKAVWRFQMPFSDGLFVAMSGTKRHNCPSFVPITRYVRSSPVSRSFPYPKNECFRVFCLAGAADCLLGGRLATVRPHPQHRAESHAVSWQCGRHRSQ